MVGRAKEGRRIMADLLSAVVEGSPYLLLWICAVRAQKKDNSR